MDAVHLLKCNQCKSDLEEFKKLYNITQQSQIQLLEFFAVFMEMSRLKAKQVEGERQSMLSRLSTQTSPIVPLNSPNFGTTLIC